MKASAQQQDLLPPEPEQLTSRSASERLFDHPGYNDQDQSMGAAAEELKRNRATFPLCCEASLLYAGPVLPVWAALHSNAATGSGFGHRFTRGRAQCGMSSARGPCLHANGCRNQLNIFVLSESLNPKKFQTMPVSAPLIILCTVVSEPGGDEVF